MKAWMYTKVIDERNSIYTLHLAQPAVEKPCDSVTSGHFLTNEELESVAREAFEAGREILTRSEHCEHFGSFRTDWDWRHERFEDYWQKKKEGKQ